MEEQEIIAALVEDISEYYAPAESAADADELKSSVELMEELAAFTDIDATSIMRQMMFEGFQFRYIDGGFVWLLKLRH